MAEERAHLKVNRLVREKSPYLLQHAYNLVDWYPWEEEAFERAKNEDKPIFLSIGYSTCHWCHVMARESFEDPEVARLMNETFVSIKVDREERPDIDAVYMQACLALTGRGGWPLSIIMTPEKLPFFAATYIPKTSRFDTTGMLDLVPKVRDLWTERRDEVRSSAGEVAAALKVALQESAGGEKPGMALVHRAFRNLEREYDRDHGGFGHAPKFPSPHVLIFLIRYWQATGEKMALEMAVKTLTEVRRGGVFDQIGFGVHRYATDDAWALPHFEKMLYDQAMLALACTEAFEATRNPACRRTADEVIAYVLRDLASPEGAFYTAEDAESEGVEGRFYLWTAPEVREVAGSDDGDLFAAAYALGERAPARVPQIGVNVPHRAGTTAEIARHAGITEEECAGRLEEVRKALLTARAGRIRPHRDEKILLDWNALMVAALARAGRVFGEERYTDAALRALAFLRAHLRDADGRLFHRYSGGETAIPAMLDDHAYLLWALNEIYQTTSDPAVLKEACEVADRMIAGFADTTGGGFFFAPEGGEELLFRQKDAYDGAMPSGNAVALQNLLVLSRLTGESRYEEVVAEGFSAFSGRAAKNTSASIWYLAALLSAVTPSYEVVIAGEREDTVTGAMLNVVRGFYIPNLTLVLRDDENAGVLADIAPHTARLTPIRGGTTAYLCRERLCEQPVQDAAALKELLRVDSHAGKYYMAYAQGMR
ncbi:MAG: thioredoxin domain-containing protein [Methanofollis sp.]|uniref:thioredoxin domain-containing protein n=1 Tax=Methanofollis sp. TaxID=2052835 RepID=UPI002606015F|nr:thioredoxin domain-containing protein [Methanofollis sp.]MDD4254619.1 thioredoxin domain-containing protein [Methanofollis sp.]